MIYRVYLCDQQQRVSDKTITGDQQDAAEAFETLVNRTDLDGQGMLAVIAKNNTKIAWHKFDHPNDPNHFWRGRIDQLPIYNVAGRPTEMDGGKRVNVYLDAESIALATRIGKGNVSEGIRKAIKIAAEESRSEIPVG